MKWTFEIVSTVTLALSYLTLSSSIPIIFNLIYPNTVFFWPLQERSTELLLATDTAAKLSHELGESRDLSKRLTLQVQSLTMEMIGDRKNAADAKVSIVCIQFVM